jgi:hypothetical protein
MLSESRQGAKTYTVIQALTTKDNSQDKMEPKTPWLADVTDIQLVQSNFSTTICVNEVWWDNVGRNKDGNADECESSEEKTRTQEYIGEYRVYYIHEYARSVQMSRLTLPFA